MKLHILIFLISLTSSFGFPTVKTWPLSELQETFDKLPEGDPMRPYLEEGAGLILVPLFSGINDVFGHAIIPSPTGARCWTKVQMTRAFNDTKTNPTIRVMVQRALETIKERSAAIIAVPAVDISIWTPSDISKYIKDPKTKPALLPFLEEAQKEIKNTKGEEKSEVTLVTPVNLVPVKKGTNPYPMGYVFQKIIYV